MNADFENILETTINQRDLRSGMFLFLLGPEWKCVCVEDYEDTHSILI